MDFSFLRKLSKKNLLHFLERRYWSFEFKDRLVIKKLIELPFGRVILRMDEDIDGKHYSKCNANI